MAMGQSSTVEQRKKIRLYFKEEGEPLERFKYRTDKI